MKKENNINKHKKKTISKTLTCYLERGIVGGDGADLVARLAPVHPGVVLLLPVDDPQEEQRPRGQEDALGLGVAGGRPGGGKDHVKKMMSGGTLALCGAVLLLRILVCWGEGG